MAFDSKRFERTRTAARTETVLFPELAGYFDDGEVPLFVFRGLTGLELEKCTGAPDRSDTLAKLAAAVSRDDIQTAKVKAALDIHDGAPYSFEVKRELWSHGLVEPKAINIVKLSEDFPTVFRQGADTVLKLTGMGREAVKKPKASGTAANSGAL